MNIYPGRDLSGYLVLPICFTAEEIATYTIWLILQLRIFTNEEVSHPRES